MNTTASQQLGMAAFRPPHSREAWNLPSCERALVHTKLSVLHGTEERGAIDKAKVAALYNRAKTEADFGAATELVDFVWRQSVEDELVGLVLTGGVAPIVAFPHPGFDDDDAIDYDAGRRLSSRNALPYAHAARLRIALTGHENVTIKQAARVGRTKLGRFPRFVYQPSFTGEVSRDRPYILVDDTLSLGGTLAMMRSYIVREGGTVIAVSALAHSLGRHLEFAQRASTSHSLIAMYGPELDALWKGEIGHDHLRLTDAEGRFLLEWGAGSGKNLAAASGQSLVHELRARLDRARATCG